MTTPTKDFHDYIVGDALAHIDNITSKRMFGGFGLYLDGLIFGIITSETELYFKADDENRVMYENSDSHQFVYTGHKNKAPKKMPYWHVPEEVIEDRSLIEDWVFSAAAVTKRAQK